MIFALYQGAIMCQVVKDGSSSALVRFDNGEQAFVDYALLDLTFDLNEGCEA